MEIDGFVSITHKKYNRNKTTKLKNFAPILQSPCKNHLTGTIIETLSGNRLPLSCDGHNVNFGRKHMFPCADCQCIELLHNIGYEFRDIRREKRSGNLFHSKIHLKDFGNKR